MNSNAAYCMQCQKQVPEEQMTKFYTGKIWRRMCVSCQSKAVDRRNAEKRRQELRANP